MTEWTPILLSLKLATVTTAVLFLLSIPIASWLAFTKWKIRPVIEALITMPLILPPTVLGFYLLLALSPTSTPGAWLEHALGLKLVFSFAGLVLASIIYSLPFMIQPIQSGLKALPPSLAEASWVLGKSSTTTLLKVLLPNIRPALLTGIVLSFAHTLGEFGVVLMIGGSIPGKTRVASVAIYENVEALNYSSANLYSMLLLGVAFIILLFVYIINRSNYSFWK